MHPSIRRGRFRTSFDVRAYRPYSRRAAERNGLRRLRADGRQVVAAPDVHGMRICRLLRFVDEQARHRALSRHAASHRSLHRARRTVGLVLCRSAVVRKVDPSVTLSESSGWGRNESSTLANVGDPLAKPGVRAVVIVDVPPYLRILVARKLDGRLDDA